MQSEKRCILFLNWKDITHPASGGAEVLTDALASHMAETHEVIYFTSAYPGCKKEESYNGYTIIRRGSLYTTGLHAFIYWHRNLAASKKYQYIIDQAHGVPFFSVLYKNHPRVITIVHEIADDLWENALPSVLQTGGKIAEKIWIRLYRKNTIITISQSTRRDLIMHGFPENDIYLLPMFTTVPAPQNSPKKKNANFTLLILGRIAPVKQIQDAISAYNIAKQSIPNLRLTIVGKSEQKYRAYKKNILAQIASDPDISLHENCTEEEKGGYLKNAHLLLMTSKKEGYGMVILEAAAYGAPTIGYQVPGIQDAIIHAKTGILVPPKNIRELANAICTILTKPQLYNDMKQEAAIHAKKHAKEHTIEAFHKIMLQYIDKK